jgi:hypothetical protein
VTVSARLLLHIDDKQLNVAQDMQDINFCLLTSTEHQGLSKQFLNHDLLVLGLSQIEGEEDVERAKIQRALQTVMSEWNQLNSTFQLIYMEFYKCGLGETSQRLLEKFRG